MQWHQDQFFDLVFDARKHSLRVAVVLPKTSPEMYGSFKKFVAARQSEETLEHRRIDPKKVRISCSRKNGNIGLLFTARDSDDQYATQKLINLMHEVYLDFLQDYYEYTIETFDLDRDQI
jgi:hypothetical protein